MQQSTKTVRMLTIVVLIAVLLGSAYGWLLVRITSLNERSAELSRTISMLTREEEQLLIAENLLDETKHERAMLASYFTTDESLATFIATLETLGEESGVATTIFSVEAIPSVQGSLIDEARIKVIAVGSWEDAIHYAALIDELPYVVDMEAAKLEGVNIDEQDGWRGTYTLRVSIIEA